MEQFDNAASLNYENHGVAKPLLILRQSYFLILSSQKLSKSWWWPIFLTLVFPNAFKWCFGNLWVHVIWLLNWICFFVVLFSCMKSFLLPSSQYSKIFCWERIVFSKQLTFFSSFNVKSKSVFCLTTQDNKWVNFSVLQPLFSSFWLVSSSPPQNQFIFSVLRYDFV